MNKKVLYGFIIILIAGGAIATVVISKNNEKDSTKEITDKTEVITNDNDKKTNSEDSDKTEGHPDSEVDSNLIGVWDLKDDPVLGDIPDYLVVKKDMILKMGNNIAPQNPVFAKDGQISYTVGISDERPLSYSYDYIVEGDKLYLLQDNTDVFKENVKDSPKTYILTRRK